MKKHIKLSRKRPKGWFKVAAAKFVRGGIIFRKKRANPKRRRNPGTHTKKLPSFFRGYGQRGKRNVAAGFVDSGGRFHPIRASFDYDAGRLAGAKKKRKKKLKKQAKSKYRLKKRAKAKHRRRS